MQQSSRMYHYEYFVRTKTFSAQRETSEFEVIAATSGLRKQEREDMFSAAVFGTHNTPRSLEKFLGGIGMARFDASRMIVSYVRLSPIRVRTHVIPEYLCVVIPVKDMEGWTGVLPVLAHSLSENPPPIFETMTYDLSLLEIPDAEPLSPEARLSCLQRLLTLLPNSTAAEQFFSALLSGNSIAISGLPMELGPRIELIQAIMLLFPPAFRPQLTFATHVFDAKSAKALIKCLYPDPNVRPSSADIEIMLPYRSKSSIVGEFRRHSYAVWLASYWDSTDEALLQFVSNLEANSPATTAAREHGTREWRSQLQLLGLQMILIGSDIDAFGKRIHRLRSELEGLENAISLANELDPEVWEQFGEMVRIAWNRRQGLRQLPEDLEALTNLIMNIVENRTKPRPLANKESLERQIREGEVPVKNVMDYFKRFMGWVRR